MNLRLERIERLLEELKYEIVRGMMNCEVEETLGFEFIVPVSHDIPNGIVHCSFRTRPMLSHMAHVTKPGLTVVRTEKKT